MNELEDRVEPLLQHMLVGSAVVLSLEAQLALATWTVKTAMVAEYLRGKPWYYTDEERRFVYDNRVPPDGVTVWLGCYHGSLVASHSLNTLAFPRRDGRLVPSHSATFAVGKLAFQVFAYRRNLTNVHVFRVERGPWDTTLLRLWAPIRDVALIWPPRHTLSDETYEMLCQRFAVLGAL